jgi:hypothetical protein
MAIVNESDVYRSISRGLGAKIQLALHRGSAPPRAALCKDRDPKVRRLRAAELFAQVVMQL